MRAGRASLMLASCAALTVVPAAAATAQPVTGVLTWGLSAATAGGDVYAAATRAGCQQACSVLLRSSDEGASWQTVAATGWSGQSPAVVETGGREYLVAAGQGGLEVSTDGGRAFQLVSGPSGALDATRSSNVAHPLLLVAVQSGAQYVESAPPVAGGARQLPAPAAVTDVRLWWNPAYPHQAGGAPAAYGSGRDPSTKDPVLLRCDAQLACTRAATIVPVSDAARLFVSPHVDDDHTILAATRTTLLRSTDGGTTFLPVTVLAPRPGTVITTVPDLTFTPDFDARRGTGHALAAVLAVTQDSNHRGTTYGGIFSSADGASWRQVGAGSALDSGAQAVAVTRSGRVVAGYVGFAPQAKGVTGGLLCSDDMQAWQPLCPAAAGSGGARAAGAASRAGQGGAPPAAGQSVASPSADAGSSAGGAAIAGSAGGSKAAARVGGSGASRLLRTAVLAAAILGALALLSEAIRRRRRASTARRPVQAQPQNSNTPRSDPVPTAENSLHGDSGATTSTSV
jgi:hypothetical protein